MDFLTDISPSVAVHELPDDTLVCSCRQVTKGQVAAAIRNGHASLASLNHTDAGTGCTSCHGVLNRLIAAYKPHGPGNPAPKPAAGAISPARVKPVKLNPVEKLKQEKDGLDAIEDIEAFAESGNWQELTEDDKQRFKWHGLFFRKQTPGHFMLRLRMTSGFSNSQQFRVIADLCDEYGKGFCDMTTRQQIQLR